MVTLLRILIFVICLVSFCIMVAGFFRQRKHWNMKTRDYWYGRCAWAFAGMFLAIEGIVRGTPFRYTLVIILAASLVTLKGNLQKGSWGNDK